MSIRLYYDDAYLTEFRARVVRRSEDGRRVVLDSSAFYPESGGQPHDLGAINGIPVIRVEEDEAGLVWHHTAEDISDPEVDCRVDWERRFDHMQQHSGQHLLSAVLEELFGFRTISFHMGTESSTIDILAPSIAAAELRAAEQRCAELVFSNRPVTIAYEDSQAASGLRKASGREGTLRIVAIDGVDRSACGGTHVRSTGEIGPVMVRSVERVRGNARLEFVAGYRALRAAQRDFEALSAIAQTYSTSLTEAPGVAAAQQARLAEAEKVRAKLAAELASLKGAQLFAEAAPGPGGLRVYVKRLNGAIDEDVRAESRGFTGAGKGVYVAVSDNPAAVLVAASADSGVNAGAELKQVLTRFGGKGGGSAQLAQGSIPSGAGVSDVLSELTAQLAR